MLWNFLFIRCWDKCIILKATASSWTQLTGVRKYVLTNKFLELYKALWIWTQTKIKCLLSLNEYSCCVFRCIWNPHLHAAVVKSLSKVILNLSWLHKDWFPANMAKWPRRMQDSILHTVMFNKRSLTWDEIKDSLACHEHAFAVLECVFISSMPRISPYSMLKQITKC